MSDVFDYIFTDPVSGDILDDCARVFSICRVPNETDAQLRTRLNNILKYQPVPSSPHLKLLVLLEKLGLVAVTGLLDTFLPVGYPRR